MRHSRTRTIFFVALSLAASALARHVPPQWQSTATRIPISTPTSPTSTTPTGPSPAPATATSTSTTAPTTPGGTYTGDITHYTVGVGSCGTTHTDNDPVCALSVAMMANGANPNTNPKCGNTITLFNPTTGTSTKATVVDTCQACAFGDVDLSPSLFETVAPNGDGRVGGIQWSFDS